MSIFHGVLPLVALLMIGAGALLLRVALEEGEEETAPAEPRAPEPRVVPEPPRAAPLRPTDGALWAGRREDAATRSGLWRP